MCLARYLSAFLLCASITVNAADGEDAFFIEGYAGRASYAPGESLTLHVSTSEPVFSVEIVRVGAETRSVWRRDGIAGAAHPVPAKASAEGCAWPAALTLEIPADWTSGYFQVALRVADGGDEFVMRNRRSAEASCFFIVRESPATTEPAKILLQLATNTYNAYNNWGGFSLYAYHGRGGNQGHRVSFQRPPASQFGKWEQVFVAWAERQGIRLAYCANADLEFHPEVLDGRNLVLSVGHDEYLVRPDARPPRGVHCRGRKRRFFQWQHLLLAGAQRGRWERPDLLETELPQRSGLRRAGWSGKPLVAMEPPPAWPSREPADRGWIPVGGISPEPRSIHGWQRRFHRPPPRALAI